ncbi:MAG: hypothetical protein H6739_14510 [Alphaproteobacteria bacterium]|nr:hypothetical protein [Alphaproteobacteria bacterium]
MRSVPAGSFARISDPVTLWRAWRRARRGKRRQPRMAAFDLEADRAVLALSRALRAGDFEPEPYHLSLVRDPKLRLIAAPSIRDRILHQALIGELAPHYARSFIHDSYAWGLGRGPHRAALRYLAWTRRHRYRLRLDIRRYFLTVRHDTLLGLYARRLRDRDTTALIAKLLEHGGGVYRAPLAIEALGLARDPVLPGRGLPIGSLLSQFSGSLYLDGLDHFAKRQLKVRAWLRFMDDVVLFDDERARLEHHREAIRSWLHSHRGLALNPKHQQVQPAHQPTTFLGYRISRAGLTPGRAMRRRLRWKVVQAAQKDTQALERCLRSYAGLVDFG